MESRFLQALNPWYSTGYEDGYHGSAENHPSKQGLDPNEVDINEAIDAYSSGSAEGKEARRNYLKREHPDCYNQGYSDGYNETNEHDGVMSYGSQEQIGAYYVGLEDGQANKVAQWQARCIYLQSQYPDCFSRGYSDGYNGVDEHDASISYGSQEEIEAYQAGMLVGEAASLAELLN